MKTLTALKVKDGWLVSITKTQTVYSEADVKELIRQENLKEQDTSNDQRLYAN